MNGKNTLNTPKVVDFNICDIKSTQNLRFCPKVADFTMNNIYDIKSTMKLYEKVNIEKLEKVIVCNNLPLNPDTDDKNWEEIFRKTLIKYRAYSIDNSVEITYKQKDNVGRLVCSYGFQNFQCDVRNYLSDNNYIDLDIKNCHPVILNKLINDNLIKDKTNVTNLISSYIISRENWLKKYNKTKLSFLKFMNCEINNDPRLDELHSQIYSKLVPILKRNNKGLFNLVKEKNKGNKFNLNGKFLARYLQNVENKLLMEIVSFVQGKGIVIGSLIHDGLMYERNERNENPLSINDLKDLQQQIILNTGFEVEFTFKSTDTEWEPVGELDLKTLENQIKVNKFVDEDENEIATFDVPAVVFKILELAKENIVYTGSNIWYKNTDSLWVNSNDDLKPLLMYYGLEMFYYKKNKNDDDDDDDAVKVYIMGLVQNWNSYVTYMVNYIKVYYVKETNFENTLNMYQGYIPFQDVVYNLKTKETIPIKDFKYRITATAGFFPKTKDLAKIEECKKIVLENFNGNEALMNEFFKFMIRAFGRECLKNWMVVCGERNSGKSLILKMFITAFSGLYGTIDGDALGYKKGSFQTPEQVNSALSPLCEFNLVCSSEMKCDLLCSEKIKTATSGGDSIIYRKAFGRTQLKPIIGGLACFMNEERPATNMDCFQTCLVFNMPCYFEEKEDTTKLAVWKKAIPAHDKWVEKPENRDAFIHFILSFYGDDKYPLFEKQKEEMVNRISGSDPFSLFCDLIEFTNNKEDKLTNEDIRKIIKRNDLELKLVSSFTKKMNLKNSEAYKIGGKRGYTNVKKKKFDVDVDDLEM